LAFSKIFNVFCWIELEIERERERERKEGVED
jgi:hypothetical protein